MSRLSVGKQGMGKQDGAALIVVLAILVVTLMLGLSSMQSSLVDERLAGNYRMQAQAQMVAEEGASEAWNRFWSTEWNNLSNMTAVIGFFSPSGAVVSSGSDFGEWSSLDDLSNSGFQGSSGEVCNTGAVARCHKYNYIRNVSSGAYGLSPGLYIVAMGAVKNEGGVVSQSRPVFMKVEVGMAPFPDLSPITITSDLYQFDAPNSNNFAVSRAGDGNVGPAIAVASDIDRDLVVQEIVGAGREGNYASNNDGEFVVTNNFDIFSNAADLQKFIEGILSSGSSNLNVVSSDVANDYIGTLDDPKITYVTGNYEYKKNIDGAGVLIVDGDFTWSGNNTFEGLIVVLGRSFTYNGGGQGSIRGSLVHASIQSDTRGEGDTWQFGLGEANEGADAFLNGGGASAFVHDVAKLQEAAKLIPPEALSGIVAETDKMKLDTPYLSRWGSG